MILTEIFLNFAHQVLKGGVEKLKSVYTPTQINEIYVGKQTLWKNVFTVYLNLQGPAQVANHYWNPTNYLNNADLSMPFQLAYKDTSDDPIDVLFKSISKCYPWETHVPRRWYNQQTSYKRYDLEQRGILDPTVKNYTLN